MMMMIMMITMTRFDGGGGDGSEDYGTTTAMPHATQIPRSHPRAASLLVRERLVRGFDCGLVAKEGLLAHGRGEAFDYLLGEITGRAAVRAIKAAAAQLLLSKRPIVSINGNVAALCPGQMITLAKHAGARLEINLFYDSAQRRQAITEALRSNGARDILGTTEDLSSSSAILPGTDSARRVVSKHGIITADTVLVSLEDGDRTAALRNAAKTVIAIDLNPLSRTAQTASITIVDNITRAARLLTDEVVRLSRMDKAEEECRQIVDGFDNKANLEESISQINDNLMGVHKTDKDARVEVP